LFLVKSLLRSTKALYSDSSSSSVFVRATTNNERKKIPQKAIMMAMNLPQSDLGE